MLGRVGEDYFEWLSQFIMTNDAQKYSSLLSLLFNTEFYWSDDIPMDENRAIDGMQMRERFSDEMNVELAYILDNLPRYCSVLEMMIALAIRCETHIMSNDDYGDRTAQWFWMMITNLGLSGMTDDKFDTGYCESIIDRFLVRMYKKNGEGGLFTVNNRPEDMRNVEIWYQLHFFLSEFGVY